jgi:hypothetical protein
LRAGNADVEPLSRRGMMLIQLLLILLLLLMRIGFAAFDASCLHDVLGAFVVESDVTSCYGQLMVTYRC